MKEIKIILVSLVCISATLGQLGLNEDRENLNRGVNCNRNCRASRPRDPVCGTNGKTYDNICDLERDICKKYKVKLKHKGECSLAEKCFDERTYRLEQEREGNTVFVPTCNEDGTYKPVQCHNYTKICWCARVDGEVIQETIEKDKEPNCSRDRTAPPPAERRPQDRCRGRKRTKFFRNLKKEVVKDYKNQASSEGGSKSNAIKWKFRNLDANGDGLVKRAEYHRLRSMVKKFVKPKQCARQFPKFCDMDNNKALSQDEWMACFSSRSSRKNQGRGRDRKKPDLNKKTKPKRPAPSCKQEREDLIQTAGNNSMPIPVCQQNGKYEPMQCHEGICVCVDEITGNSLDGTGLANGTPDCTKPYPHAREWPGCVGENKTAFMQHLKKFLLNKAEDNQRTPVTDASSPQSVEEFTAMYHFSRLDKDNNGFLEKKERKIVKKMLKRSSKFKICSRRLAEYCDFNKDQKVSQDEWVACVILKPPQNGVNTGEDVVRGEKTRRLKENPLIIYLTSEDEEKYYRRQRHAQRGRIHSRIFSFH